MESSLAGGRGFSTASQRKSLFLNKIRQINSYRRCREWGWISPTHAPKLIILFLWKDLAVSLNPFSIFYPFLMEKEKTMLALGTGHVWGVKNCSTHRSSCSLWSSHSSPVKIRQNPSQKRWWIGKRDGKLCTCWPSTHLNPAESTAEPAPNPGHPVHFC